MPKPQNPCYAKAVPETWQAVLHTDPRQLLETLEARGGHDEVSARALEVSRKLFDFAGMADSIGNAAKWCQDTVNQVQSKVVGVQEAATLIQGANGYVQESTQLTGQAWDSMKGLSGKMGTIYKGASFRISSVRTTCIENDSKSFE
ncbi:unnamed protein product [Symbiodinium necroappetens]|uniref:Uncharacterized protein n=1 Tax=Symbiodinium necroappetens TaxID=1628268 RepID=A0A812RYT7_9DINO|nr:unnamed protein product [Symbiodinium necroappetens]